MNFNLSANDTKEPIIIGFDGEFGYLHSTSAEAISAGIQIAINEINQKGGLLGGRPLKLIEKANHSIPARSLHNIKEFAKIPDLVAVFCGRFSPTILQILDEVHKDKIVLLNVWGAADSIIDNNFNPNYAFRLSLKDSWAMPTMMEYSKFKGADKVGLLLINTAWGRSNLKVAETYVKEHPELKIAKTTWFNWDIETFMDKYEEFVEAGAKSILVVGNAIDVRFLLQEVASLPKEKQLPIISHWGVTGENLPELVGDDLHKIDFSFVQTYTFIDKNSTKAQKVMNEAKKIFNVKSERELPSPVGIAHSYDLTHILALAITEANSTNREKIRDALENIDSYDGLIKKYEPPFSKNNHEALSLELVFISKYDKKDNAIIPIWFNKK